MEFAKLQSRVGHNRAKGSSPAALDFVTLYKLLTYHMLRNIEKEEEITLLDYSTSYSLFSEV